MLGDAYGAAVVEALSKKELEAMDEERAKQLEDDLESAQTDLKGKKVSRLDCIFFAQKCFVFSIMTVVLTLSLGQIFLPQFKTDLQPIKKI